MGKWGVRPLTPNQVELLRLHREAIRQEYLRKEAEAEAKRKEELRKEAEEKGYCWQLDSDPLGFEPPRRVWAVTGRVGPPITEQEFEDFLETIRQRRVAKKKDEEAKKKDGEKNGDA